MAEVIAAANLWIVYKVITERQDHMGRTECHLTDRKMKTGIAALSRTLAVLLPALLLWLFIIPCRVSATTLPGKVTGLTGVPGGMTSVDLTWNAAASVNG
ncbi:MAG: hypothetical protein K6E75_12060, partial [Lachnospiraceae bacterium]|nr:hypothetical protein [Lachnospiraceae bacterium]